MHNNISILGTLTDNLELKYTQNGNAIGSFSIAVNEVYKDQNGNKIEKAHFFKVNCFGKQAETINQYFFKGSRILISGQLVQDRWQDQQTGENRSAVSIKLNSFEFVDRKSDTQPQMQQPQPQNYVNGANGQQVPVYHEQVPQQQQNYNPQQY